MLSEILWQVIVGVLVAQALPPLRLSPVARKACSRGARKDEYVRIQAYIQHNDMSYPGSLVCISPTAFLRCFSAQALRWHSQLLFHRTALTLNTLSANNTPPAKFWQ